MQNEYTYILNASRALAAEGKTLTHAAEILGISRGRMRYIAQREKINFDGVKRAAERWTDTEDAQLIALLERGMTPDVIFAAGTFSGRTALGIRRRMQRIYGAQEAATPPLSFRNAMHQAMYAPWRLT